MSLDEIRLKHLTTNALRFARKLKSLIPFALLSDFAPQR